MWIYFVLFSRVLTLNVQNLNNGYCERHQWSMKFCQCVVHYPLWFCWKRLSLWVALLLNINLKSRKTLMLLRALQFMYLSDECFHKYFPGLQCSNWAFLLVPLHDINVSFAIISLKLTAKSTFDFYTCTLMFIHTPYTPVAVLGSKALNFEV